MNKRDAKALWDKLREGLLDVERTIINIIANRAWEPLGYSTFTEAWEDNLSDVNFSHAVIAHAAYQMFEEGMTPDDVAGYLHNVGPERAKNLARQRENGVPADEARPNRRGRGGERISERGTIWLHPGPERVNLWVRIATQRGVSVEKIIIDAAEAEFERLADEFD